MTLRLWEVLEPQLAAYELSGLDFSNGELAEMMNVSRPEASRLIQSYLNAQRSEKTPTSYVLKRTGRTKNARWSVGQRTKDVRVVSRMFGDDTKAKLRRAFEPDLQAIGRINPRARRAIQTTVDAVVNGAMQVLEAAVRGYDLGDDS